ncbi:MAG: DNA repair exonuclease [Candidatus Methanomethyliaceae archaeon]|nr:DNA repair exonuclease [Candidatus Methanomethyliaceae archaeon]
MKFAHMSDIHLGATTEPRLRELEISTLNRAFQICMDRDVDFIIISGDLFHVNIPDLFIVKEAVKIMKRFVDLGRKIYVVYGSHDYSPNATSIVDILEEAGLIRRVGKPSFSNGKLRPEIIVDERTSAMITGISGRKLSLERDYFRYLDREYFSSLKGYKIFVFHSAIEELKRKGEYYEGIASSDLPNGFDYYAGGHLHRRVEDPRRKIFYPGPLFTGWGIDLENTIKGERRGFFLVEDGRVEFLDLTPFQGIYKEIDATGLSAFELNSKIKNFIDNTDVGNKVIVLKVFGVLSRGKTSDVEFSRIREEIMKRGALYLHLNRSQLRSKEFESSTPIGEDIQKIEENIFKEAVSNRKFSESKLTNEVVALSRALFNQLRVQRKEGEREADYEKRMEEIALEILGIKDLPSG